MDRKGHRRLVVLAGGIGSGKSTVGAMLAERGARVIDSDAIGRRLLEPGGEAFERVAARWPDAVAAGRIDRGRLAAIVFTDPAELAALEAMTHPHIRAGIAAAATAATEPVVVAEVPVRFELAGPDAIVVVVDAPDEVRLRRSVERGMAEDQVIARMAAQPSRHEWLERADYVLRNDADEVALDQRVEELWRWLTADGPGSPAGHVAPPG